MQDCTKKSLTSLLLQKPNTIRPKSFLPKLLFVQHPPWLDLGVGGLCTSVLCSDFVTLPAFAYLRVAMLRRPQALPGWNPYVSSDSSIHAFAG